MNTILIERKAAIKWLLIFCVFWGCKNQEKSMSSSNKVLPCKPCDIYLLRDLETKIPKISGTEITKFLYTMQNQCKTNIEFTEYSNQILFSLLEKNTDALIKELSKKSLIDLDYILYQISTPLLDYNIKELIVKVEKTKEGTSQLKIQLIESLKNGNTQ